jgi:FkbM family methyltransferase
MPVRLETIGDSLVIQSPQRIADTTHQLVDAAGNQLLVHPGERDPVSAEITRNGFWELPETLILLAALRPGSRVVDVGAHVGYFSVLAARSVRMSGRVYAFEPAPENQLLLTANASLTRLLDPDAAPIETSERAVSDRSGNVRLYLSDRNPAEHATVPGPNGAIESRVVPSITIDLLRWPTEPAGEASPTIDGPVNTLKIDVAGGEFSVLQGSERTLREDCPVVIVTLRPAAAGVEPCVSQLEWLSQRGYSAFRIAPPTVPEPYSLLAEVARILSLSEMVERVRKKMVPKQFGLVAYPNSADPSLTVG